MLVSEVLASVASRMGLDGIPDDVSEKSRWLSHCADAQRSIVRKNLYWFTQDTKGLSTVTGRNRYSLDSAFREMISVTLNGNYIDPSTEHESSVRVTNGLPFRPNLLNFSSTYFIYNNEINIPHGGITAPTTFSVSSITRSGTTVTVTTTAEHGFLADEFIMVEGAVQTDYNGSQRIYTIPSATTFTFLTTTTPTTPATGTITVTQQNLVYRFYKTPTTPTAMTSTLIIPDLFWEGFVSYVKARVDMANDQRGSAGDGLDEFNQIIEDLDVENNRRNFANVTISTY